MKPSERLKKIEEESPWGRNELCNEIVWLIARIKRLTEALEEFADYKNPNEPRHLCWPASEYVIKARKVLEDDSPEGIDK